MTTSTVFDALAQQFDSLEQLLQSLDEAGWNAPVPRCPGWSVSDVVLHLAQTNEMAAASAQGRLGEAVSSWTGNNVDEGADHMVEAERGAAPADVLARWRAAADDSLSSLRDVDPSERVQWVAGTLAPRTLATTRLSETWIHTGDVADAVGTPPPMPTEVLRQIAWLAWKTLPYAFQRDGEAMSGEVAVVVTSPDGDEWTFGDPSSAATVVRGPAQEWCLVAARRLDPSSTSLTADGPDADAVLRLARTYA